MVAARPTSAAAACTPSRTPPSAPAWAATCGSLTGTDNCGASRTATSCGSCTSPQTCGGGGTANVCGAPTGQTPYGGSAWAIPGTIQAEDYDEGGEGVAYHDTTAGNGHALPQRDVDIGSANCGTGCYNIGWGANGEWNEYTANVASTGTYELQLRIAINTAPAQHLEVDGVAAPAGELPNTGGYTAYHTITGPASPDGRHPGGAQAVPTPP